MQTMQTRAQKSNAEEQAQKLSTMVKNALPSGYTVQPKTSELLHEHGVYYGEDYLGGFCWSGRDNLWMRVSGDRPKASANCQRRLTEVAKAINLALVTLRPQNR